MNLGDVSAKTVPKVCIVSRPFKGGNISTRTFIPHRCHEAIGVLGAVSVASACMLDGSVANEVTTGLVAGHRMLLDIEHPTGSFGVSVEVSPKTGEITRTALLRTARKLMSGQVYVSTQNMALSQAQP